MTSIPAPFIWECPPCPRDWFETVHFLTLFSLSSWFTFTFLVPGTLNVWISNCMVCVITGTLPPNEANVKNGGKMTISRDDAVLTSHRQSSFSKCHNNVKNVQYSCLPMRLVVPNAKGRIPVKPEFILRLQFKLRWSKCSFIKFGHL